MKGGRLRTLKALVLAGALVLGGCDEEGGPGTLRVEVSGPVPLGAVALELTGRGIRQVRPMAGGWVVGQGLQDEGTESYRIVAVREVPGDVVLLVEVDDVGRRLPAARVLQASDGTDAVLPSLGEVVVEVRR